MSLPAEMTDAPLKTRKEIEQREFRAFFDAWTRDGMEPLSRERIERKEIKGMLTGKLQPTSKE